MASDRVTINIGGTRFMTTSTTIANAGQDSMLSKLLDEDWQPKKKPKEEEAEEAELFVDRNPVYFAVLLDLLRTGELRIPAGMSQQALLREARFYGLASHVRAASWQCPLDGNRVSLASSLNGRAAEYDGAALVRASPTGGCCVCHDRVVHTYDWSLQEQQPVSLDMVLVRDAGFLAGDQRLVVCTYDRGDQVGGMACFNPCSGLLEHRFRLPVPGSSNNQTRNFSAAAMASSQREGKLFAITSARSPSTSGIGTWSSETGQYEGFFPMPSSCCKLQWVEINSLLLAASMHPEAESCHLWLLDPRAPPEAAAVWEWSQGREDSVVKDVAATFGGTAICLVNQYANLRFLDTRASLPSRWSKQFKQVKLSESEEHSYAKLRANPGCDSQVFCSRQDAVLVYGSLSSSSSSSPCRSSEASLLKGVMPTSRLPISTGGRCCCCCSCSSKGRELSNDSSRSVADMDVGGDRLFVLHGEDNVVDVWQTPLIH